MRMLNPPRAGAVTRSEIITPLSLCVAPAAQVLGGLPTLSKLLNSSGDLAGNAASQIEKATGVKGDTPIRTQWPLDITRTSRHEGKTAVRRYQPAETYP